MSVLRLFSYFVAWVFSQVHRRVTVGDTRYVFVCLLACVIVIMRQPSILPGDPEKSFASFFVREHELVRKIAIVRNMCSR